MYESHCNHYLDQSQEKFHSKTVKQPKINFGIGRMVLNDMTPQELAEPYTWQFFIRARVAG